jgi:Ca2+/H+ antiporter
MSEDERKDKLERLQRYETLRREQLGTAITLIQTLAAAGVAFCIAHIADEKARFTDKLGTWLFVIASFMFVATVGLCMLTTFTRLRDFRNTAKKLRAELRNAPDSELKKLGDTNRMLGRRTWLLFRVEAIMFFLGVFVLAVSIWMLQHDHLFPKEKPRATEQVTLIDGRTVEPYVITGKYSVDEATHVEQMADCKEKVATSRNDINSRKLKPGENLLFDSYDVASLGAHICASWAAEPLDKASRDVIDEAINLDNRIMAHERVRYEDVKAQLDYYQKRFH